MTIVQTMTNQTIHCPIEPDVDNGKYDFLFIAPKVSIPCSSSSSAAPLFNMHFNACLFYVLTLLSFVSSYAIPFQEIRIHPSEKHMKRLSRFLIRREPQPSTSIAAGSVSTPTSSPSPSISTVASHSPTISSAIPQPSQPPPATNDSPKYVVAHHMVGNTFPYTLDDWAEDIALAHAAGIDGFALNIGSDSWEPARVADA